MNISQFNGEEIIHTRSLLPDGPDDYQDQRQVHRVVESEMGQREKTGRP